MPGRARLPAVGTTGGRLLPDRRGESRTVGGTRHGGAYQGVFNAGQTVGLTIAPAVVTLSAIEHGPASWAILAALFILSGAGLVPAVRWAAHQRTRPDQSAALD